MATLNIGADLKNYIVNLIKSTVRDVYYPIGRTYITMGSEDPNKTIGGTWVKIYGGYLYGAKNSLGSTNYSGWGAQSTKLSIDQMPTHDHTFYYTTNSDGFASGRSVSARSSASDNIQKNGDYTFYSWTQTSGGGQGHTHNIATIDVWIWKRTK